VDVTPAMADPADLSIPRCVDDFEAAIALLRVSHAQWQQQPPAADTP
jgi:hypothetical protein